MLLERLAFPVVDSGVPCPPPAVTAANDEKMAGPGREFDLWCAVDAVRRSGSQDPDFHTV